MIELTKLKSKEVDLPFLFKDTKSDCRWIEYWLRHALARPSVSIQCKLQFWRRDVRFNPVHVFKPTGAAAKRNLLLKAQQV